MSYVLGVDLGTSAIKVLLMNRQGQVVDEQSVSYPLIQNQVGYNEQNPAEWVEGAKTAISNIVAKLGGASSEIEGISFSGQMHGLVLLNKDNEVIRPAILWNDTRNTVQCQQIIEKLGMENLLRITKNTVLEGFTLPKILWVQQFEPQLYAQAATFLLPKDYVRFAMTGHLAMDYSDAAGTSLFDMSSKDWSDEILQTFSIERNLCPPLVEATQFVGMISGDFAKETGLSSDTKVFAGGADNACGALGAGLVDAGDTMVSIGTSGVLLSIEEDASKDFNGDLHYFNHAIAEGYYSMGVTLSAGHSLEWYKKVVANDWEFEQLLAEITNTEIGANGLLFTPYLVGERTPYADAKIRASFIGLSSSHERRHLTRAVVEGITFSLNDILQLMKASGKKVQSIVSIGGGAKNAQWLQIQADIFNTPIIRLQQEQGPGVGAAMIAAFGLGWYESMQSCARAFVQVVEEIKPIAENVDRYEELYHLYRQVYLQTKQLNDQLHEFRQKKTVESTTS